MSVIADHLNYIYSADTAYEHKALDDVSFKIEDDNAIQFVVDWFGKNARVYKRNGNQYATVTGNENALFYWYMQYSESFTVLAPQSLVQRVRDEAERILKKHGK